VAAILLSGGASSRMGQDKTQLIVDGTTLAARTGTLLQRVVQSAVEVGPGTSGLSFTVEDPPREGPLAAIAAGVAWLRESGHSGDALVIACDLPRLSEQLLRFLVEFDSLGSVVPVVKGQPQPLCAKWGRRDLDSVSEFLALGARSLKHLYDQPDVCFLDESQWRYFAQEDDFFDIDTPADLQQFRHST
jgi:molybdopterin-guanine dinucleotide biosynthesis protein A